MNSKKHLLICYKALLGIYFIGFIFTPDISASSVLKLDHPDVWIYSELKGQEKYDVRKKIFQKYDIKGSELIKIIKRENEDIFVARKGVSRFDTAAKKLDSMSVDFPGKDDEIQSLYDFEKGFYIGMKGALGYYEYNKNRWQSIGLPGDFKGEKVKNIFPGEKSLLIITEKNLLKFSPDEKEYRITFSGAINESLFAGKTGKAYFLTDTGIMSVDMKTFKIVKLEGLDDVKARKIWLDEEGNSLWIAGERKFVKYGLEKNKIEDYTKDCLVSKLMEDKEGYGIEKKISINDLKVDKDTIWITTEGGGIIELQKRGPEPKIKRWTEKDGLPSNFVNSLAIDDVRIFASFNDGLAKMEKGKNKWDTLRIPSEIKITESLQSLGGEKEKQGKLKADSLILTPDYYGVLIDGKLFLYLKKEAEWVDINSKLKIENEKIKNLATNKNILWLVTEKDRIIEYSVDTDTQEIIYPAGKYKAKLNTPLISDEKYLYIGAGNNLLSYNKKEKVWENVLSDIPAENSITVFIDDFSFIWIGTKSNGLTRFDKNTKKAKIYTKKEGLLSNFVSLIGMDNDYVWVVHEPQSISRFSKMTNFWDTFEKVKGQKEKFKIKKFIPNEVLEPSEKRWKIPAGWRISEEIKGDFGGKWIIGELELALNPLQIAGDSKFPWTWFISDGQLIKYNQADDTFIVKVPAQLIINNDEFVLIAENNSIKIVRKEVFGD